MFFFSTEIQKNTQKSEEEKWQCAKLRKTTQKMRTVAQTENSEKHLNMAAKFEYLREICIFYGKFGNLPQKYLEIWPTNRKFATGFQKRLLRIKNPVPGKMLARTKN